MLMWPFVLTEVSQVRRPRCLGLTVSSDGLSRHLRRCKVAQQDRTVIREFESINAMKQTREKRACDNCAEQKLKCTSDAPCDQCRKKDLQCVYTRNGYVDPYERFRVDAERNDKHSNNVHEAFNVQPDGTVATGNGACSVEQHMIEPDDMSFQSFDHPGIWGLDQAVTDPHSIAYSELSGGGWLPSGFTPEDFDTELGLTLPYLPGLDANGFSDASLPADLRAPRPDSVSVADRGEISARSLHHSMLTLPECKVPSACQLHHWHLPAAA